METIHFLQQYANPALDQLLLAITHLADEPAYLALLVIIYLAVSPTIGRRVGIALLASLFLNFHLKGIVDTARPYTLDPTIARGEQAIATAPGAGFPSGHAQGAATFWGYLAVQLRRPGWWVVAAVLVALVSLSRVYLGVHLPVDILGGLAIAVVVIAVAHPVQRLSARYAPTWPRPLRFALGLLAPLAAQLLLPAAGSALLMGGLAAFLTAPLLIRHQLPESLGRRAVAAGTGLVLVFGVLVGSSALLPEAVKADPIGGFARYLLLGYAGLALAPYLLRRIGVAPAPAAQRGEAGQPVP